jgi:hypothetical protein
MDPAVEILELLPTRVERLDPDGPVVKLVRFEIVVVFNIVTKLERLDPDVPLVIAVRLDPDVPVVKPVRLDPDVPVVIVEMLVSAAGVNIVLKVLITVVFSTKLKLKGAGAPAPVAVFETTKFPLASHPNL